MYHVVYINKEKIPDLENDNYSVLPITDANAIKKYDGAHWVSVYPYQKCPVCESGHIRKDFDNPQNMRCCNTCGCDFTVDGEITFDPKETE